MNEDLRNNCIPDFIVHWEKYNHLYYTGEYVELIEYQKNYVEQHPSSDTERLLLADAYMYHLDYENALTILNELSEKNQDDKEIHETLIKCLEKRSEPKKSN